MTCKNSLPYNLLTFHKMIVYEKQELKMSKYSENLISKYGITYWFLVFFYIENLINLICVCSLLKSSIHKFDKIGFG